VTGSNSKLMSSEISTYLTGRYVSIPVYTLSFREYLFFFRTIFVFRLKLQNKHQQLLIPQRL
jgi:predicted AAA+ superfamily ATPase